MEDTGCQVGGESSGAIIAPSKCRDGWLTLLYILAAMKHFDKDLDELVESLPKYITLSEKITLRTCPVMENMAFYLAKEHNLRISHRTDGSVKAIRDDSWLSVRCSNTEPGVLRIMSDSAEKEKAQELIRIAKLALEVNI